jgi:O-antigen/teichoic acid export membrane protein
MSSFARGAFQLMAAQTVFMLSGYALNVFLARYFGPELYGAYGVVMAVLVWAEIFVINGIPTAMQKFLAESPAANLVRLGRRLQIGYTVVVLLLFVALAPAISAWLREPEFKKFLWIAAPDILLYGLYWFYLGVYNGLHRFEAQALIVVTYGLSKVASCIGLVLAGVGIAGAFIGNFLGSAVGLMIGLWQLKRASLAETATTGSEHWSRFTKFATPIILYNLSLNAVFYLDLLFVKRFLPPVTAGYYVAAATIAKVPYFIFLGLGFTILPVLSRTLAQENLAESRRLLQQTMRVLFVLLAPVLALVIANAESLVAFLYTATYHPAAPILHLLIVSIALYTLWMVFSTIMSADGQPHRAFQMSLAAAIIDVILCWIFIPRWGGRGAAMATLGASACGMVMTGACVLRRFGFIIPWRSLLRVMIAGAASWVMSMWWISAGWMLLIELIAVFGFYLFLLYILGELKDFNKIFA